MESIFAPTMRIQRGFRATKLKAYAIVICNNSLEQSRQMKRHVVSLQPLLTPQPWSQPRPGHALQIEEILSRKECCHVRQTNFSTDADEEVPQPPVLHIRPNDERWGLACPTRSMERFHP